MTAPEPRKGSPSPRLDEGEFKRRFLSQYPDPAFDPIRADLDRVAGAAWDAYANERKSPQTRKAGPGYADPDYDLAVDWIAAKEAIDEARARHQDKSGPSRILLVNGSSRSEHTCPGEVSKSFRLLEMAKAIFEDAGMRTRTLDLSRLGSEYGRKIHPCKGCFSTAAALCHFPCSCYPNYSLGQTQDWMNEIYPMWIEAHGVFIVTPINWYQSPSPLKLMTDRLVCADGGNTDPTSTHGKTAKEAKELELKGWEYKRQLSGRLFGLVVHGDVEGARGVREAIHDWLCFTDMCPAGPTAMVDRYIGYWKPYATSHEELDADLAIQEETRNAARALVEGVQATRDGRMVTAGNNLKPPREK